MYRDGGGREGFLRLPHRICGARVLGCEIAPTCFIDWLGLDEMIYGYGRRYFSR